MATSASQGDYYGDYGNREIDQQTVTQFCTLNPALFSSVDCTSLNCLPAQVTPQGTASCGINIIPEKFTGGNGNICPADCGNPTFGAICRTLQPGFLVCLAPGQCVPSSPR
jgi:hypothetical protein